MPTQTLYFVPISQLSETQGTWFGNPTGSMFDSNEVGNGQADNNGAGFTPATLQLTGTPTQIKIADNDWTFHDDGDTYTSVIQEQTLAEPWGGYPAGTKVEPNYGYRLIGSDGSYVTIYAVNIMSNAPDTTVEGIVADTPLQPGVTYTVVDVTEIASTCYSLLAICFAAGTRIDTPDGLRQVETLRAGDVVKTDQGALPLIWAGSQLHRADDGNWHKRAPFRITAGALMENSASQDLIVSPQHRLLIKSPVARRMFGADEVLLRARDLEALPGVQQELAMRQVSYVHLLFDRHALVRANGVWAESLLLGPQARNVLGARVSDWLCATYPQLTDATYQPARQIVQGRRARRLVARLAAKAARSSVLFAA